MSARNETTKTTFQVIQICLYFVMLFDFVQKTACEKVKVQKQDLWENHGRQSYFCENRIGFFFYYMYIVSSKKGKQSLSIETLTKSLINSVPLFNLKTFI